MSRLPRTTAKASLRVLTVDKCCTYPSKFSLRKRIFKQCKCINGPENHPGMRCIETSESGGKFLIKSEHYSKKLYMARLKLLQTQRRLPKQRQAFFLDIKLRYFRFRRHDGQSYQYR